MFETPPFPIDRTLPYLFNPEGKFLTKNRSWGKSDDLEKNSAGRDPFDLRGHRASPKRCTDFQQLHNKYHRGRAARCILATALILFFLPGRSGAETVNQRAEAEARAFLIPCSKLHDPEKSNCLGNHADFVEAYLHAKAGQVDWMSSSVSSYLGLNASPTRGSGWVGIREDKRQACAWVLVEREATADADRRSVLLHTFRTWCGAVSPNELIAISERADQLLYELRRNPVIAPPDWKPNPKENLTTTVPASRPD